MNTRVHYSPSGCCWARLEPRLGQPHHQAAVETQAPEPSGQSPSGPVGHPVDDLDATPRRAVEALCREPGRANYRGPPSISTCNASPRGAKSQGRSMAGS